MPHSARCPAPAKINLALHVTGQTADGYHALESLVAFCQPADELSLEPAQGDRAVTLETGGPFGTELDNDDNLVLKAATLLAGRFPVAFGEAGAIRFKLEKNLPVASGIGGGSADAAAALLLLRGMLDLPLNDSALMALGAELGSDVPMCLASSALVARGRGIDIEPVSGFPELFLVLVNPGVSVSTPAVFAALEQKHNPPLALLPERLAAEALTDWLAGQRNDLQPPALKLAPAVGEVLSVLEKAGAALSRMSGSGATCFGLFADLAEAQEAARSIAASRSGWWVMATQTADFGMDRACPDRG
ncbi:MAG: 4-(cytidine 5'-diphospho)-2-C-methyl-D-erythritol kinase [Nitratireductor sp.]|nr:4-(cytidine 5'-diphospho)-2-C-methyl-D-erythritol kinase [Nitratireductor sp.]